MLHCKQNITFENTTKERRSISPYVWSDDLIFRSYMRSINNIPLLTKEREKELAIIIQSNKDKQTVLEARNELICSNLKLVVKCAYKFYIKLHDPGQTKITLLDLIMEGNLGLINAARLFNPKFDNKFSSYATPSITNQISAGFKQYRFIKIPIRHFRYFNMINDIKRYYDGLNNDELQKKSKVPTYSFDRIMEEQGFINDDLVSLSLFDEEVIAGEEKSPLDIIAEKEQREYLLLKVSELPPSLKEVVWINFFHPDEINMTAIAQKLGITKQAVSQRIKKGLKILNRVIKREGTIIFNKTIKKGAKHEHHKTKRNSECK